MICHPESSPGLRDIGERVGDPRDECMGESCHLLYVLDIWLDVDTLILHYTEPVAEYLLLPCILRCMSDIEGSESAGVEVLSVGLGSSAMVVEIFWVVFFL